MQLEKQDWLTCLSSKTAHRIAFIYIHPHDYHHPHLQLSCLIFLPLLSPGCETLTHDVLLLFGPLCLCWEEKKKWNEGLNTRLLVSKVCTKEKSMVKQTKIKLEKQQEAEGKYSVVRRHHTGT